jgi:hypothetical protein
MSDLKLKTIINESSVSRFYEYVLEHDSAILTSFRTIPEKTRQQNLLTNKDLKAYLMEQGYGVTPVKGSYIQNYNTELAKEVKENSYFVVNRKDSPNFVSDIIKLGKKYNQDSVIIINKGGQSSYLYGTNNAEFPGYNQIDQQGRFRPKREDEFMSRIGKSKQPISFSDKVDVPIVKESKRGLLETLDNYTINGKHSISIHAKKVEESLSKMKF